MTLLVCVASGAWADPTYKDDFTDGQVIWLTSANVGNADSGFIKDGWASRNSTDTGSATLTINPSTDETITGTSQTYCKVKVKGTRDLTIYVTGVSAIKVYGWAGKDRTLNADVNDGTTNTTVALITHDNNTQGSGSATISSLDPDKNYAVTFHATNDSYPCAIKMTVPEKDTRNPLTLSFTSTTGSYNIAVDGTLSTSLSWIEDTSSESAKYTTTYASTDEAVAAVNSSGVVTGVAVGSTTITATVTADADATYKTTTKTITVNVVSAITWSANYGVPTAKLDLSDADAASTMLNGTWHNDYGRAFFGNDGNSNYLTYSVVGAYSSTSEQTWVKAAKGSSAGYEWSSTGVFKGYSSYMASGKAATVSTGDNKYYAFRVKGVSKVQALAKSNSNSQTVTLAAFELTGDTPAANTLLYGTCGNTESTISVNLDNAKEYAIILFNDGSSNSRLCEMALFYDESVDVYETATITAAKYATYVTTNRVTVPTGVSAYIVSGATAAEATLSDPLTVIPAKTPVVIYKDVDANTDVNFVVTGDDADDVAGNVLKSAASNMSQSDATDGYAMYVLNKVNDVVGFYKLSATGTLAAGKCYIEVANGGATPAPEFVPFGFGGETTDLREKVIVNSEKFLSEESVARNATAPVYDLAGQRVAQPSKGLYIVNGRKVVIK